MSDIGMIVMLHGYGYSHRHINRMIAWKNTGVSNDC
jgi:hypothetical protein